jgi:hypothetical protein
MLNPARSADKTEQSLHRTEMSSTRPSVVSRALNTGRASSVTYDRTRMVKLRGRERGKADREARVPVRPAVTYIGLQPPALPDVG